MEGDEVNVFDIFKVPDIGEDVMTIVEGSPGIGKTTFCLKLAYDWAHGNIPSECSFPKFEFVFLLKCRDIDGDVMEAISEQLLPRNMDMEKSVEKLLHFMKDIRNQERLILIILDGLDELPEKSRHHVDELLHRRILPFCFVLATTRQERGIEVRKSVVFDIHLEIKGYTESDSVAYVRRHFETIGQSPRGERLVEEIQRNTFLHALRNNPLNLFLLCVVYEDYEGKLPTSRTELYQVIVQCLLRRYCAKRNWPAPEDDSVLKKMFGKEILALGELAWLCLLSDRYGFRETELDEFKRRYPGLVARELGLLYKEESLKRLKPQHEYCFLHKTFQEYLAAAFIAHKLRGNQLRLFERLSFHELVKKYREVFLFVSGILGRDASILFTQIGEELKNWGEWNWFWCTQSGVVTMDDREREDDWDDWDNDDEEDQGWEAATFLTKSISETGHAEKMAETFCFCLPFPAHVEIILPSCYNIYHVLEAFRKFSNLQKPVCLTFHDRLRLKDSNYQTVVEYIKVCSELQTLSIFTTRAMKSDLAIALRNGLSGNTTLSEFTLEVCGSIPCDAAVVIGELLASCKSLKNVKFLLRRVQDVAWASAIETGLSADTLLSSVSLSVRWSLSETAVHGLGKLLSNESLTSFSLNIFGDMQDVVAAAISKGIAQQTALKSIDVGIDGNLSHFAANVLVRGLLENRTLKDLKMSVRGRVPDNWQALAKRVRLGNKALVTLSVHPGSCRRITHNQLPYFCPGADVVEKGLQTKQHLTVVLWGELSFDGAEALFEALVLSPLTSLTLKVHGKFTYRVANCIARYIRRHKTLCSMKIDIWGELDPGTGAILQGLLDNHVTVQVNVHDVCVVPDELCNGLDVCIDSIESLSSVLNAIKDTRDEKIKLKIINDDGASQDWTNLVGDALAENKTVTALDVTINNHKTNVTADLGKDLGKSLLRSSSLTVINLAINNYSNMAKGWECRLVNCLAKVTSLTTLSLAIEDHGAQRTAEESVGDSLMVMTSLSTLSVVINGSNLDEFWSCFLRNCLVENTSLCLLCVTVNNYNNNGNENDNDSVDSFCYSADSDESEYWFTGLADGLARTASLNELTLTINDDTFPCNCWIESVCEGLEENETVTSLTVTTSSDAGSAFCEMLVSDLRNGLALNKSLTTFTLIINVYTEGERLKGYVPCLDEAMNHMNTSFSTLNLTINICREATADWLPNICRLLEKRSSLTTFRLNVNNHCATNESRIYDFSKLRLNCRSLSSFERTVTFYGE